MPDAEWEARVRFSTDGAFAYVPGEIVVAGESGVDAVNARSSSGFSTPEAVFPDLDPSSGFTQYYRMTNDDDDPAVDTLALIEDLRDDGVVAQPNHVLLAHCGCGCACGPHPAMGWADPLHASPLYASPLYASPLYASPLYASPLYASPLYASPLYASPLYASPLYASGRRKSSARPAQAPATVAQYERSTSESSSSPWITVLDTGFADETLRPAALPAVTAVRGDRELPDEDNDLFLDPAAGHGTFIAGVVDQLAPGCDITVGKVLSTYGDGNEVDIAKRIRDTAGLVDLLNLSFGGYAPAQMRVLASAVRHVQSTGAVVVASAGNDGTCRPTYPAALPGVVSVGAVGPTGPAPFSNYGPWVRACAPGVDIVSAFFSEFHGARVPVGGEPDPDEFHEWAMWSGTSFAAPAVTAALAREMQLFGITPAVAVERVVDARGLLRIPGLGTVVNIV